MNTSLSLGFDLNGLWDFVAEGGDYPDILLKDLGVHGSLVRLAGAGQERWIGGIQASLAPHGKGQGWGQIGASGNRVFLKDLLVGIAENNPANNHAVALQGFLESMAEEDRETFFAVPDVPDFDEAARDRLLRLLLRVHRMRSTLLWRPMAAILGWIEEPTEVGTFSPEDGMRIAVLSLLDTGVQVADVKLVREHWNGLDLWVPERDRAGIEVSGSFAGKTLAREAARRLADQVGVDVGMALSLANGLSAAGEHYRRNQGDSKETRCGLSTFTRAKNLPADWAAQRQMLGFPTAK